MSAAERRIPSGVLLLMTMTRGSAPASRNAFAVSYSQLVPGKTGMTTRGLAVRTAGDGPVKFFLKNVKGDAVAAIAHDRTHDLLPLSNKYQHSIGQELYLAVPPIFFLTASDKTCRCNGRPPAHLLAHGFRLAARRVLFAGLHRMAHTVPYSLRRSSPRYFSRLKRF